MTRPTKVGIDYFPLDNDIDSDVKIQMLEVEMGLVGFALYIKLLAMIYRDEGYFAWWDEKNAKLFAKKNDVEVLVIDKFIKVCINEGIFEKGIYEKHKILTSRGIQKRYIKICERRKELIFIKQILLFKVEDIKKEFTGINVNIKDINVSNNPINVNINQDNDNKKTESKVKESKVNESKEDDGASSSITGRKKMPFLTMDQYKSKIVEIIQEYVTDGYKESDLKREANLCWKSNLEKKGGIKYTSTYTNWLKNEIKWGNLKKEDKPKARQYLD